jgi:DNA repair/transcription protein MET18/MMS19
MHVKMTALTQPARCLVFSIVDTIVARHREGATSCHYKYCRQCCKHQLSALKAVNSEFLQGYLSLVEGEKDPRNLVVVFAICRVLLVEFDIAEYVEVSVKSFKNITLLRRD